VLSGEGSDELMAGYAGLEGMRAMFARHDRFHVLSPLAKALLLLPLSYDFRQKLTTTASSAADFLARTKATNTEVFTLDFLREFGAGGVARIDIAAALQQYYAARQSWDGLDLYLGGMIEWWLPDDLLHKADRMTMAHSVELRCPFLDLEYAAHCAGLAMDSKVTDSHAEPNRKIALKKAFTNLLPEGLAVRNKRGFSIPAYEWVQSVYRSRIEQELVRPDSLGSALIPVQIRRELFERAVGGSLLDQRRVWSLIVLNKWGDRWL